MFYTRAHFGYLGHYNDDLGPSPFEGFDVGGDGMSGFNIYGYEVIALRGYENGSLTPRVNGLKSGNVYTRLTMELRYPITLNPSGKKPPKELTGFRSLTKFSTVPTLLSTNGLQVEP